MNAYTPPFDGAPCPMCPIEYRNLSAVVHNVLDHAENWPQHHASFQKRYAALVELLACEPPDITPETPLGRLLTSLLALTGYAIIAVPTGILSSELSKLDGDDTTEACPSCGVHGHLPDAKFCRRCGSPIWPFTR